MKETTGNISSEYEFILNNPEAAATDILAVPGIFKRKRLEEYQPTIYEFTKN